MKISYKTKDMSMTRAIEDYADKKFSAMDRFIDQNDQSVLCEVELGKTTRHHKSGDFFRAEINLHIAGKDLYAASEKEDLYFAIDEVKDEIIQQITSHRNKTTTLMRKGALQIKNMVREWTPRRWRK